MARRETACEPRLPLEPGRRHCVARELGAKELDRDPCSVGTRPREDEPGRPLAEKGVEAVAAHGATGPQGALAHACDYPRPTMIRYRLLGPLEVRSDGVPLPLPGSKPSALLARLLLDARR